MRSPAVTAAGGGQQAQARGARRLSARACPRLGSGSGSRAARWRTQAIVAVKHHSHTLPKYESDPGGRSCDYEIAAARWSARRWRWPEGERESSPSCRPQRAPVESGGAGFPHTHTCALTWVWRSKILAQDARGGAFVGERASHKRGTGSAPRGKSRGRDHAKKAGDNRARRPPRPASAAHACSPVHASQSPGARRATCKALRLLRRARTHKSGHTVENQQCHRMVPRSPRPSRRTGDPPPGPGACCRARFGTLSAAGRPLTAATTCQHTSQQVQSQKLLCCC